MDSDQNRFHHEVSSELEWHEKNRRILDEIAKVTDGMRADDRERKLRVAKFKGD